MLTLMLLPLFTSMQVPTCPALAVPGYCQNAEASEPLEYCGHRLRIEAEGPDPSELAREERALADSPTHTATNWFELACVRSAIAQWVSTLKTHPVRIGKRGRGDWYEQALTAALAAARDAPRDTTLMLLSSLILRGGVGRPHPAGWREHVLNISWAPSIEGVTRDAREALPLLQHAAEQASPDTTLLRACTAIALDLDEFGVAHECAVRALSRRYEPSWNLLRLAWLASRRADTSGALNLFTRAIESAGSRSERLAVAWHFKTAIDNTQPFWGLVTRASRLRDPIPEASKSKDDSTAWLDLPQSQRLAWIDQKTSGGDANGWRSLSDPAVLVEHFASVAFAGEVFRDCLPDDAAVVCNRSKDLRAVQARRLRFWDSRGHPVAVFPFAAKAHPAHDSLRVVVRQTDQSQNGRPDTVSVLLSGDGGLVAVPTSDTWDSWTLDIDPPHPARQVDFQDFQPSAGTAPVILSDLAVGQASSGVTWINGDTAISIAPTSTFSRAAPLHLYYQVRCDSGCAEIERTVRVRGVAPARENSKSVTLTERAVLHAGINNFSRELDLTHLVAGSYRLEVEIRTESSRSVKRATLLILR